MKALSTLDSSTQYIVLFKLTNFNSVTVIISHWFLSFSWPVIKRYNKCASFSLSYTEGNFQFQFQLMLSGKNEPWDACL